MLALPLLSLGVRVGGRSEAQLGVPVEVQVGLADIAVAELRGLELPRHRLALAGQPRPDVELGGGPGPDVQLGGRAGPHVELGGAPGRRGRRSAGCRHHR